MTHQVRHATFLQKLFKRKPRTPPSRPHDILLTPEQGHLFSGVAQIDAFHAAYFDRLRFEDGEVDDLHITEPGKKPPAVGYLDLGGDHAALPSAPARSGEALAATIQAARETLRPRRRA